MKPRARSSSVVAGSGVSSTYLAFAGLLCVWAVSPVTEKHARMPKPAKRPVIKGLLHTRGTSYHYSSPCRFSCANTCTSQGNALQILLTDRTALYFQEVRLTVTVGLSVIVSATDHRFTLSGVPCPSDASAPQEDAPTAVRCDLPHVSPGLQSSSAAWLCRWAWTKRCAAALRYRVGDPRSGAILGVPHRRIALGVAELGDQLSAMNRCIVSTPQAMAEADGNRGDPCAWQSASA